MAGEQWVQRAAARIKGVWRRAVDRTSAVAPLLIVLLCAGYPAQAALVDRVVAAVNTEVITLSELQQTVGFNQAMSGGADRGRLVAQTLEGLVNRKLLLQEARRLRYVEVTPADITAEQGKLLARFGSEQALGDFLDSLGMAREDLRRMLGERLFVERFVEKKIGLFIRVAHDEAREFYEGHPVEFEGKRFADVQKQIVSLLMAEKLGTQVEEYLAELRSKADIRMNPLGQDEAPPSLR